MGEIKGSKGADGRDRAAGSRRADGRSGSSGGKRADGRATGSRGTNGRSTASGGRRPDGKSIAPGGKRAEGRSIRSGGDEEVYAASTRHRGRRKKRKGSVVSNIILVIAIAVFCVSAYKLFTIGKGYYDGRSEYDKIKNLAIGDGDGGGEEGAPKVNFDELKAINPDTVAWIRFDPEPKIIDYPVVQGKDNQEYLHKTFSANDNSLGTIFLNVDNNPNFTDENSIIYGHRMKDGSMFRHLVDYEDKAFWEANPYFYIYTPDGQEIKYHIYSMGQVVDTSDTYLTEFASQEEYQNFLNMTKEVSLYDTGVEVNTSDTIVTLSTCTSASDEHRFVVRGVRVKEGTEQVQ
ncbi:MAG: class B sortase [Lachnospiraceae bacterium]